MRLATVLDNVEGYALPRPVIVMPDGARLEYANAISVLRINRPSGIEVDRQTFRSSESWEFERLDAVVPRTDELLQWWTRQDGMPGKKEFLKPAIQNAPLLPPVPRPRAFRDFYAFEQHVKTCRAKRKLDMVPQWYEIPVFYFSNPGSLIGHEAPVAAPEGCAELDYELELAVIIGKAGKNIREQDAWDYVAGFTIVNDFSARDLQRKEMAVGLGPAKGKDFATGVGPVLVTLDEFKDRIDASGRVKLEMSARVNGKELSRGNAQAMHFSWPQMIAQASRDAELYPGDLIGSGTVGTGCILELGPENTGGWLKSGDMIELEIERIGVLRNKVVPRGAAS
jgi:fumarylacetoacetate (FAA) hydrolase